MSEICSVRFYWATPCVRTPPKAGIENTALQNGMHQYRISCEICTLYFNIFFTLIFTLLCPRPHRAEALSDDARPSDV